MIPFILVPLAFLALVFIMLSLFYRFGGWHKMSQKYKYMDSLTDGEIIKWSSIVINKRAKYQGMVSITVTKVGLHVRPMKFLQFVWHQPFLIPWSEVVSTDSVSKLVATFTVLNLASGDQVRIPNKVGKTIKKMGIEIGQ